MEIVFLLTFFLECRCFWRRYLLQFLALANGLHELFPRRGYALKRRSQLSLRGLRGYVKRKVAYYKEEGKRE